MKKINFIIFSLIFITNIFFLYSCDRDDELLNLYVEFIETIDNYDCYEVKNIVTKSFAENERKMYSEKIVSNHTSTIKESTYTQNSDEKNIYTKESPSITIVTYSDDKLEKYNMYKDDGKVTWLKGSINKGETYEILLNDYKIKSPPFTDYVKKVEIIGKEVIDNKECSIIRIHIDRSYGIKILKDQYPLVDMSSEKINNALSSITDGYFTFWYDDLRRVTKVSTDSTIYYNAFVVLHNEQNELHENGLKSVNKYFTETYYYFDDCTDIVLPEVYGEFVIDPIED